MRSRRTQKIERVSIVRRVNDDDDVVVVVVVLGERERRVLSLW
jgi:hypothetical protein